MAWRRTRSIWLVIFALPVLFLVLELVARHFDPYVASRRGRRNPFWQKHPTRGRCLKPGNFGSIWNVPFHVNSLGFRSPEISKSKPRGVSRVFCMGDSITMGSGLPEYALYPAVLQKILSERYPRKKFEVVNAGVSGYMIDQELLQLKEEGLGLSPDLVVLQFTLYDPPGTSFFDHISPRRELSIPGRQFLYDHSALARHVAMRYYLIGLNHNWLGLGDYLAMPEDSAKARRIEAAWEEYYAKLLELDKICQSRKIPLVVVIAPHRWQFKDRKREFRPQKKMLAFGKANEVAIIDPSPEFEAQKMFAYASAHPGAEGHAIMAELLADWISRNFFPGKPL